MLLNTIAPVARMSVADPRLSSKPTSACFSTAPTASFSSIASLINPTYLKQLEQNTEQWYTARQMFSVTASVVPALCGMDSPSRQMHWEITTNRAQKPAGPAWLEDAFKYGHEAEPVARSLFQDVYGFDVKETGLHPHPVFGEHVPYLAGSPDGIYLNEKGEVEVLEIKCPYMLTCFADVSEKRIAKNLAQLYTNIECVENAVGGTLMYYFSDTDCGFVRVRKTDINYNEVYAPHVLTYCAALHLDRKPPVLSKKQREHERQFWSHHLSRYEPSRKFSLPEKGELGCLWPGE